MQHLERHHRTCTVARVLLAGLAVFVPTSIAPAGDFAAQVLAYTPAPGQFVNNSLFNQPGMALGPPVGGGTRAADNTKVVTLGGFGGSIVLRFSDPVINDPCNPYGLDAIVFSNAVWVDGNPARRFAEAAVIEISRDTNNNGVPDDPWFVIPGSHITASPPQAQRETQPWDNSSGTPTPPTNLAWFPISAPPTFSTATFALPALFDVQVLQNPNGQNSTREGIWGYADCSPTLILGDTNADNLVEDPSLTPAQFYTSPDNPFEVGITLGSGGGDAFDIEWALDPATGAPAALESFDFIRLSNGVNFVAGVLGEISSEVGGAADVRPQEAFYDRTADGVADLEDLYAWHALREASSSAADLNGDAQTTEADRRAMQRCIRRSEASDLATP